MLKLETVINKSPLRYPGGKTRACGILNKILEEHFDMSQFTNIVSPFFGGGSFEFYIQNKYKFKIIGNDKFTPLYYFWKMCKYNNNELCNKLYSNIEKIDKETFYKFREKIMNEDNELISAIYYFIINRCSFSGATLSGGFSLESSQKRFTISSIDRVKELNLENFEIDNIDFEDFINKNNSVENFIFLDPPYYLEKNQNYMEIMEICMKNSTTINYLCVYQIKKIG